MSSWTYAETVEEAYKEACRKAVANPEYFRTFKRQAAYRSVLEHVDFDLGIKYLNIIRAKYPHLLIDFEQFRENDDVGSPITHPFNINGKTIQVSPTTIRYVKVLGDLEANFDLDKVTQIIEIGGGYGGQAFVLNRVYPHIRYRIYDLPEVADLINEYVDQIEGTVYTKNGGNPFTLTVAFPWAELNDDSCDLAISNYAFSELSGLAQSLYKENVLDNAARQYLTINHAVILDQDEYEVVPDTPLTDIWLKGVEE